jgi:hypothetical protein
VPEPRAMTGIIHIEKMLGVNEFEFELKKEDR